MKWPSFFHALFGAFRLTAKHSVKFVLVLSKAIGFMAGRFKRCLRQLYKEMYRADNRYRPLRPRFTPPGRVYDLVIVLAAVALGIVSLL